MSWSIQLVNSVIGDIRVGPSYDLTALGFSKLKRHLKSLAASTFSFTETARQMDGAPFAGIHQPCVISYIPPSGGDPVVLFQGKVTKIPRVGASKNEARQYVISDAWNDLERLVYQQQWNHITGKADDGTSVKALEYRSEFVLGEDVNGNPQNSDAAIMDVLAWAISCGAQLQAGDILVGGGGPAPVPFKSMQDLPCSAVIQELIRLTPDAVGWFDYATTPPTFHVTRRAACGNLTVPFSGVPESISLTSRDDLVRSQVLLRYVAQNTVDGFDTTTTTLDSAPDGADGTAFDALVATVRLEGSSSVFQKQPVKTTPLPTSSNANADGGPANDPTIQWWLGSLPWMGDHADQLVITNVYAKYNVGQGDDDGTGTVAVDFTQYPNVLNEGGLADWMNVQWARCTVTALVKYSYPASESDYTDQDDEAVEQFGPDDGSGFSPAFVAAANLTLTNAVTQTYTSLSGFTDAEPVPEGLAAVLYSSLSVLHYEGSYSYVQTDVTSTLLGIVLNITGSQQPWAAMNALVQEITDDLDEGRTTINVGPPHQLSIQDLMDQLRWTRTRAPSGSRASQRASGSSASPTVNGVSASNSVNGANPPGGAGAVKIDPTPFQVIKITSGSGDETTELFGVITNSHLLVSADTGSYEEDNSDWGLLKQDESNTGNADEGTAAFAANVGDKCWLQITLDDSQNITSVDVEHGPAWGNYPDPISINGSGTAEAYQQYLNVLIAEFTDPTGDPRPGLVIGGVKRVQVLTTNLMATAATATPDADDPGLSLMVAVPWTTGCATSADGSGSRIASPTMTPWQLGVAEKLPSDTTRSYIKTFLPQSVDGDGNPLGGPTWFKLTQDGVDRSIWFNDDGSEVASDLADGSPIFADDEFDTCAPGDLDEE